MTTHTHRNQSAGQPDQPVQPIAMVAKSAALRHDTAMSMYIYIQPPLESPD